MLRSIEKTACWRFFHLLFITWFSRSGWKAECSARLAVEGLQSVTGNAFLSGKALLIVGLNGTISRFIKLFEDSCAKQSSWECDAGTLDSAKAG
jgi:hypothetical protein